MFREPLKELVVPLQELNSFYLRNLLFVVFLLIVSSMEEVKTSFFLLQNPKNFPQIRCMIHLYCISSSHSVVNTKG